MRSAYFLHNNFIDPETVADVEVSSEETPTYPYLNALDRYRRVKKWRSNGHWEVLGSENTLVFRETIAVNLTATVTAATYGTTALLCAAIKAALDAAGDSTYTVTVNSSHKIEITSNGVGGGGIFQIMTTNVASAGFCDLVGYSTDLDKTGSLTYAADLIRCHTSEYFKWDLGTAANPKAFVMSSAGNNYFNISSTATILLQANGTDDWSNPAFVQEIPFDQRHMVLVSSTGLAPVPYRFWRLIMFDVDNIDGFIEIHSLYLGDAYSPARGAVQFPMVIGYSDRSETLLSEGGSTFGLKKDKLGRFSTEWSALTFAEKEYLDTIYEKFGKVRPLFMAFDGAAAFSSDSNYYVRFCLFDREPEAELSSPNFFSMKIEFKETI